MADTQTRSDTSSGALGTVKNTISISEEVKLPLESSVSGTVPDYIGYPGTEYNKSNSNDDRFRKHMEERFQVAYIRPITHTIPKDANIYEDDGKGWQNFKNALKEYAGVNPPNTETDYLKVVLSNLTPISEEYENQFGDSELLNMATPKGGGMASDVGYFLGVDNARKSLGNLKKDSSNKIVSSLAGAAEGMLNMGEDIGGYIGNVVGGEDGKKLGSSIGKIATDAFTNPWAKIGWPQMWKNCSFSQGYSLTTRLYCYNSAQDSTEYNDNIIAALAALQLFCTPKSESGVLYTWPFLLELVIPGSVWIPMGYMSSLSIIKGGDYIDFAMTGRPNIIDVRFNIQNSYGICVATNENNDNLYKQRPTVRKQLKALLSGRNLSATSDFGISNKIQTKEKNVRTINVKDYQFGTVNQNTTRIQQSQSQQAAAEALSQT